MNSPHPSGQALFENLGFGSQQFVADVLGSLSAGQRLESESIFKALAGTIFPKETLNKHPNYRA